MLAESLDQWEWLCCCIDLFAYQHDCWTCCFRWNAIRVGCLTRYERYQPYCTLVPFPHCLVDKSSAITITSWTWPIPKPDDFQHKSTHTVFCGANLIAHTSHTSTFCHLQVFGMPDLFQHLSTIVCNEIMNLVFLGGSCGCIGCDWLDGSLLSISRRLPNRLYAVELLATKYHCHGLAYAVGFVFHSLKLRSMFARSTCAVCGLMTSTADREATGIRMACLYGGTSKAEQSLCCAMQPAASVECQHCCPTSWSYCHVIGRFNSVSMCFSIV